MKLEKVIQQIDAIRYFYKKGLHAVLKGDRKKIRCKYSKNTRGIIGSLYLDEALKPLYPNSFRWDYGIGWKQDSKKEYVVWVEVHPATPGEVKTILEKGKFLTHWLQNEGKALSSLSYSPYIWIASGTVSLLRNSPEARSLAQAGVRFPHKILYLDELEREPFQSK